MRGLFFILALLLVFILAPICDAQAQGAIPRFERGICPIDTPNGLSLECGYLVTVEDYDDPKSRAIRMPVIIIPSRDPNPSKRALLFTEGGPGYSSLSAVWWLAGAQFAQNRDIVILEQRGNKYAEPGLTCDFSVWWDEIGGQTPCLDSLMERGITLEHYTIASIAADINALMQVLGYNQWDLFGTSYSTRVMQLVLARYPEKIHAVVLHSISPLTDSRYKHDPEHASRALKVMLEDCAVDLNCAEAYPDLESQIYSLVRQLNADPIAFEMSFPQSTERFILEVDGDTLMGWFAGSAFYGPAYPPFETAYIPLLIDELSRGNTDLLYPWAKNHISRWADDSFAWGLYFSINCQDEAVYIDSGMIETQTAAYPELDGFFRHRDELGICAAWGLGAASPLPPEPVTSDIPVLALAGTYDPVTPPDWSRTALTNLSRVTFVEFPGLGHSVLANNPCAENIVTDFLDKPAVTPDTSCVKDAPGPQFVLPGNILIAPAMYEIHYGELGYSMLEENLFLSSWLGLVVSGVIALIAGLVKLARWRRQSFSGTGARLAHLLLVILAITALVWGYALRFSLQHVAASQFNVLRFGLPSEYWWIFASVILIGSMTIALVGLNVLSWWRKQGSVLSRIFFTLAALSGVIFNSLLAHWGLYTALIR